MSDTTDAVTYVAEGAGVGALLGIAGAAFNNDSAFLGAAGNGALVGTGVVALGGLVVGLVSEKNREVALETAGISFGAFVLVGIARAIAGKAA
jgi:hypothetical protein